MVTEWLMELPGIIAYPGTPYTFTLTFQRSVRGFTLSYKIDDPIRAWFNPYRCGDYVSFLHEIPFITTDAGLQDAINRMKGFLKMHKEMTGKFTVENQQP